MAEADNKALVRRLLEELRGGWRPATVEKYFASSYRRHLTATSTPLTREQQLERANRLGDQPDLIRQMRGSPPAP